MQKIVILHNLDRGNTEHETEFDIPLTIETLKQSISKKYQVFLLEADLQIDNWIRKLRQIEPEIVFNIAEGYYGAAREAFYPAILEQLNYKYTGPGPSELLIAHNKNVTKKLAQQLQIPTVKGVCIHNQQDYERLKTQITEIGFPIILKLNTEGSSLGMDENCVVNSVELLEKQIEKLFTRFHSAIIIEQYIPGRDLSMTFIEGLGIFGPVEYIYPESDIYDFRLKSKDNYQVQIITNPKIEIEIQRQLHDFTGLISEFIGFNGYNRVDFRLSNLNKLYLLEINGQVSFHPDGAFVLATQRHGIDFDSTVHHIISFALTNARRNAKIWP